MGLGVEPSEIFSIMMAELVGDICLFAYGLQNQMVGAGAQVTHDGPGVAPTREAGAGVVETRDSPKAAPSREVRTVVLT
jgi:hypothetical protein